MRFHRFFFAAGLLVFLIGCQTQPTKVFQTDPAAQKKVPEVSIPRVTEKTVFVDARPAFESSLSPFPGAVSLRWEDFAQREAPFQGLLQKDLFFHARRLARLGLDLETPIVVIGRGLLGEGEEGRLAWTLMMMGLRNVQFGNIDQFSVPPRRGDEAPRVAVPIWKPDVNTSLVIDKTQFLKLVMSPRSSPDAPVIIDVRSETDYLGKAYNYYSQNAPDLGTINIPWHQFLDEMGRPSPAIVGRLEAVGIHRQRPIVLIDEKGIKSAAITLVLRELGYSSATLFAGGYMELLGHTK